MKINKTDIIGEVASKYPITVSVFLKYGIEFCCKGNITLEESSKRDNFDLDLVLSELSKLVDFNNSEDIDLSSKTLPEIAEYIKNTFHLPIRELLYPTEVLAKKVAMVHGESHKELYEIRDIVEGLVPVLEMHFDKEGQILHPMLNELQNNFDNNTELKPLHCGSIKNPIRQMESEHDNYGDMLLELKKLTSNYTLPDGACRSYQALYANLQKLEEDLMRHTNLENFILHPRAIEIENKISGNSSCGF
ncbi:MAG: DUF542 domain-containing protein [Candidatus Gracilibacteria bacterium]|nr:DUF542 domain-containing protein [Candidatus Gracilibacteria bacterium]